MPHIKINLLEGKTEAQKQELTDEIIKVAKKVLDYGDDAFSVAIQDYTKEEWKDDVYPNQIIDEEKKLFKKPGYKY